MPSSPDRAEPRATVNAAISHVRCARVLNTIVVHGVPDIIGTDSLRVAEVASSAGLHAPALERSLRLLAAFGIFVEVAPGTFRNNDASALLLRDRAGGLRNWTLYATSRYIWDAVGATDQALRTGGSAFERVHGASLWDYLRAHSDDDAVFNAMFGELWGAGQHDAIAAAYDWSSASTVADIGGGNGALLATILSANEHLEGVLVDQPEVLEQAEANLDDRGVRARCRLVAASFFGELPVVADVWLLSQILHDWDDERSGLILDRCRTRLRAADRLVVVEMVTVPGAPDRLVALADIHMLTLFGEARQRSETEYQALFGRHGLVLQAVVPTNGPFSLVVARPG
jgi:hypothetical protein